jgi:drug/metabolite transporter (DMT)-like permease
MSRFERFFPWIFLLIPVTWAGSFIAGKFVLAELTPITSVALRFLLSGLFMLPWLLLTKFRLHPRFRDPGYMRHLLVVVLTAGIGYHVLFFRGLASTSPTNAALIIALNPFFTALAEVFLFQHRRPIRFYIGFVLAFGGAAWVNLSRGGTLRFNHSFKGELYLLAAALLWSVYTLYARKTKRPHWDSLWLNAYNYLLTGIILLPFVPGFPGLQNWQYISGVSWAGIIYMAIFPTAIGYTLFYIGVQKKGPGWAVTYIYLVPSFAALLELFFFKTAVTIPLLLGTAIVLSGLLLGNMSDKMIRIILRSDSKTTQAD